jgi:hypothetical protein
MLIMRTTATANVLLWLCATAAASLPAIELTKRPVVHRDGQTVTLSFVVSGSTDVEVAILNAEGQVVRHLAAGVLGGKNPPPAPLMPGLSQKITWDGLDDYGVPVADVSVCSVRVRAGMGVRLDRIVGGNPYAYYSREMGQGDHAAWRITGLEAKSDGKVYVLGNANNYGPPALRQFDAAGNYLRTVYPPPAGKPLETVSGWGIYKRADGTYSFQYNDLSSPALSTTIISGTRGRIATLIPSSETDQLLLERDFQLMKIHTDGSVRATPMLKDRLVNEPALAPTDKNPRRGPWRITGQMQTALSADGV